jgi:hypothetical protein
VFPTRSLLSSGESQARTFAGSVRVGLWRPLSSRVRAFRGGRPSGAPSPDLSAAYAEIAATLALGTVAVEAERTQGGSAHIWLDPGGVLAKLEAMRAPPETYSDVIIRVARVSCSNPGAFIPVEWS